ncbi:MAG: hypothetical protein B7X28_08555 [Halothiobacillus sp. 13-55-253]|nr:MAG: hypothetical protein B7X28_08555 [Halothiobacillus sp. 13-55-253]
MGLMLLVVAAAAVLAVVQDARSLAVLGIIGGFLAPILAGSDSGRHVDLFSYYLVLDFGIVFVAWRKAWRELNLLAFLFTFVIGTIWGGLNYKPALFSTTEPFLIVWPGAHSAWARSILCCGWGCGALSVSISRF